MPPPPKAFISYSQDSPEHAGRVRALADRLCGDGVDCMIDQYEPHPREPWPRWMDRQIEEADFVLVVCTETYLRRSQGREKPGSGLGGTFESVLIVQDLYDAGMSNEKFIPVLFEGTSVQAIPKPLRGYSHYRPDTEDGYESLLRHLRNEPRVRKPEVKPGRPLPQVPASAPSSGYRSMAQPPEAFIHRQEYHEVFAALCPETGTVESMSVGITTALRGAGGFGKTALAQALCQDARVRQAYPDGILWTTMGEDIDANGRLARVRDLIRWWTRKEAPAFETVTAAGARLRELLTGSRALVVVDDVWSPADVTPFQGLGKGSAVLITTRDSQALPADTARVNVDAMEPSEAVSLLGLGLPDGFFKELQSLAARLGEWALLLKLVNRQLQELVKEDGLPVPKALREIGEALESQGFSAFDRDDKESRHAAASQAILVSVRRLPERERALYFQLAVFPEDARVPLSVLERFWGLSHFQTRKFCRRLHDLSLLLEFDGESEVIRLHDVVRRVLIEQIEDISSLHSRLLDAFRPTSGAWSDLPAGESYLWRNLAHHFVGAERLGEFRKLLFDFSFLEAKLRATDINALIEDYESFSGEVELRLIRDALRLSSHVLSKDRRQLASQLLGRLAGRNEPDIRQLIEEARTWQGGPWLRPRTANLIQPGGALIRVLQGHTATINAVAVVDGYRIVSSSDDGTLRVWNLETGQTLRTLGGHTSAVSAVAVVDSRRAVSASHDGTLQLWDLESGQALRIFKGHKPGIHAVAVVDGRRVISGSPDWWTLRVWDLKTGRTVRTLKGHAAPVRAVTVVDGRRAISSSDDETLRVWDLETGQTLRTLEADAWEVITVARRRAVSAIRRLRIWDLETGETLRILEGNEDWESALVKVDDGHRVVPTSYAWTLRVWDIETGETLRTLEGQTAEIDAVAAVDDRRVVFSSEGTLRVWDLETGQTMRAFGADSDWVTALAVVDGHRVVSASNGGTLRVWDLETDQISLTPEGHRDPVNSLLVVDSRFAVSASEEEWAAQVWDLETGQVLHILHGHWAWVTALAVVDSRCVVSASDDRTLRLWDLETGQTLRTLEGHSAEVKAVTVVNNRRIVSASTDKTLRLWDLETGDSLRTLEGHSAEVNRVVRVDDHRVISASSDRTLRLWDLENGEPLRKGQSRWTEILAVMDGVRVVSVSSKSLRLWELETGKTIRIVETAAASRAVAVVDVHRAVLGFGDGTLQVWDLETGESLRTLEGHTGEVTMVVVLDGRRAASGSQDRTLRVWDLETGEMLAVTTLEAPVSAVAATPNGRCVVAGDQSGRVYFFDWMEPE